MSLLASKSIFNSLIEFQLFPIRLNKSQDNKSQDKYNSY